MFPKVGSPLLGCPPPCPHLPPNSAITSATTRLHVAITSG
jgi:hypothetical protein